MSRTMRQRLLIHNIRSPPPTSRPSPISLSGLSTLAAPSPPSTSRPPPRIPSEAPKHAQSQSQSQSSQSSHSQQSQSQSQSSHHPSPPQIALTHPPSSQTNGLPSSSSLSGFPGPAPLNPSAPGINTPPAGKGSVPSAPGAAEHMPRARKRKRLEYRMDVGAYGIAKSRPQGGHSCRHHHHPHPHSHHHQQQQQLRAYGTHAHGAGSGWMAMEHADRSVQVGEDAYFVRPDAMGVADGVGGWARVAARHGHYHQNQLPAGPTPSAMFARRLMHFCAAEIEALEAMNELLTADLGLGSSSSSSASGASSAAASLSSSASSTGVSGTNTPLESHRRPPAAPFTFAFEHRLKPRSAAQAAAEWDDDKISAAFERSAKYDDEVGAGMGFENIAEEEELGMEELDEALDELEDGIDVLRILERAYDSTVRAHVVPVLVPVREAATSPASTSASSSSSASTSTSSLTPYSSSMPTSTFTHTSTPTPPTASTHTTTTTRTKTEPITTGSSTALLAVLDHAPSPFPSNLPPSSSGGKPIGAGVRSGTYPDPEEGRNYARGSLFVEMREGSSADVGAAVVSEDNAMTLEGKENVKGKESAKEERCDAVVHIAHLGDCMGMLVRGDEIAWRSDEMWWGYNHPLQLGPPKPETWFDDAVTGGGLNLTSANTASTSTPLTTSTSTIPTKTSTSPKSSTTGAAAAEMAKNRETTGASRLLAELHGRGRRWSLSSNNANGYTESTSDAGDLHEKAPRVPPQPQAQFQAQAQSQAESKSHQQQQSAPTHVQPLIPLPVRPHTFTLPVRADDILILASDGLGDNLWDEDVLDEVVRVRRAMGGCAWAAGGVASTEGVKTKMGEEDGEKLAQPIVFRRKAFASMLAEALCSRAKRVSEPPIRKPVCRMSAGEKKDIGTTEAGGWDGARNTNTQTQRQREREAGEVPFGRRAREAGKVFRGGKCDDISVVVAVISPAGVLI